MVDWSELVRAEGSGVMRTIQRLVRNQADADDCFQETFVAAFALSKREDVMSWPALLKRMAVARAVDCLRKQLRQREQSADAALFATTEHDPPRRAECVELAESLRAALAQLKPPRAEIFCLIELEDWSYQEIAQEYAMTTSTVGVMQHRTRQKLKRLLSGVVQDTPEETSP